MSARRHRSRSWADIALNVVLAVTPAVALALMMWVPLSPLSWGVR